MKFICSKINECDDKACPHRESHDDCGHTCERVVDGARCVRGFAAGDSKDGDGGDYDTEATGGDMMCLCGCKETVEKYRSYRDAGNQIRWAWFLECANCHFAFKKLRDGRDWQKKII